MTPEALLEWGKVILGFAGPIMVVWVSAKMNQDQKTRDSEERQRKQDQADRDQRFADSLDALGRKVDRLDAELSSVKTTVEGMERMDAKVHTDLAMLNRYHEVNVKHIQQVSNVVTTIGEGLRDNNIDGKLTSAVTNLRNFETNMYTDLFSSAPLASDRKD